MVEINWKEPPPTVSSEKATILAELKKNPGRWALVQSGYKSSSGAAPWRKLGCEAVHRRADTTQDGAAEYDIYARWPAEPAAKASPSKAEVSKAVTGGTALRPPAPAPGSPADTAGGFTKFLASQRAGTQARTQ